MRLGFIGLGNMGSELARHLLAAGHTLSTYARGERSRAHAGGYQFSTAEWRTRGVWAKY